MLRRKFASNIKIAKTNDSDNKNEHDDDDNEQEDNDVVKDANTPRKGVDDEGGDEEDDDEMNQSLPYFSIVKMIRFADLKKTFNSFRIPT